MNGNPDERMRPQQRTRGRHIAVRRQVHAINTGPSGEVGVAVQRQPCAVPLCDGCEAPRERDLLVRRQILLAQAHPAATAGARARNDIFQRQLRLRTIGDDKQRRSSCLLQRDSDTSLGFEPGYHVWGDQRDSNGCHRASQLHGNRIQRRRKRERYLEHYCD